MITAAGLRSLGVDPAVWSSPLIDAMGLYGIDSDEREAMFLAQCLHESAGLTQLVENLNYSASGLLTTFPKYFTPAQAAAYARQPARIANHVYAGRMDNGDESSGDGWAYRGRGILQLTGRLMYSRCGKALGFNLAASPELLEQPLYACLSAAWFWSANRCNELADTGNFAAVTRRINGGTNGQAEREIWLARVRRAAG